MRTVKTIGRCLWMILIIFISCHTAFEFSNKKNIQLCSDIVYDQDTLYLNDKTVVFLADILNQSIPDTIFKVKFGISDYGGPTKFFIFDLTDTCNNTFSSNGRIYFINHHVYHFAPYDMPFSYSHIAYFDDGEIKVFRSLNCPEKGNTIDEVIHYLERELVDNSKKIEILFRVKHYRSYGKYLMIDPQSSINCY